MTDITCGCGTVRLEARGAPIISAICHCTSCSTAGRELDRASGHDPIVDDHGGTSMVLWRKDRLVCVTGGEQLESRRLTPESPTRRLVATCCKTPICLDFTKGFWLSVYGGRPTVSVPPTMRLMTTDLPAGTTLPDDGLRRPGRNSIPFVLRLMATWARMGFRSPSVQGLPPG